MRSQESLDAYTRALDSALDTYLTTTLFPADSVFSERDIEVIRQTVRSHYFARFQKVTDDTPFLEIESGQIRDSLASMMAFADIMADLKNSARQTLSLQLDPDDPDRGATIAQMVKDFKPSYARGQNPYIQPIDELGVQEVAEPDERERSPEELALIKYHDKKLWSYRHYGSMPEKGYTILSGTGTNRDKVVYLGDSVSSETIYAIVEAHNQVVGSFKFHRAPSDVRNTVSMEQEVTPVQILDILFGGKRSKEKLQEMLGTGFVIAFGAAEAALLAEQLSKKD